MLKVIEGDRYLLECALIQAICLGQTKIYQDLAHRLNHRANLSLLHNQVPDEQKVHHQSDETLI